MGDAFALGRHERRVARRLEARGDPGLGEILARLAGTEVGGRWRIESLYAVGAEGAVFLATDRRAPGPVAHVAKVPLVPYHRPALLSSSVVRHRRQALRDEARNLSRSASPFMPAATDVSEFRNPLLDARRGGAFTEPDPVLVMERLPGIDVDRWIARVHRSGIDRAVVREHLDRAAVLLLRALEDLNERGFVYADLRPGNLRTTGRPLRGLRLLDGGSLVEAGDRSGKFPHVPHYLPPELFSVRHKLDLPIVPTASVQAVMAGRTLYEIATGRVPVPGELVDPAALRTACVSPHVAEVIDGLAAGSFETVLHALRYLTRGATRRAAVAGAAPTGGAPTTPSTAPVAQPTAAPRPSSPVPAAAAGRGTPSGGARVPAGAAPGAAPALASARESAVRPTDGWWVRVARRLRSLLGGGARPGAGPG